MSDDEFDDFGELPNLFDNIDWNTIPELSDPIAAQPSIPDVQAESTVELEGLSQDVGSPDSSQYSCDEIQFDDELLGLLDVLEERAVQGNASTSLQQQPAATTARPVTAAPPPMLPAPISTHLQANTPKPADKHTKRSGSPLMYGSPRKKGKHHETFEDSGTETQVRERMDAYLASFQEELTCPICCDIFAASHVGNPCGHSFCGECGWQWVERCGNNAPSCPVCRTLLSLDVPMLPNITVDNNVQKHIEALQTNGYDDWKPGGVRHSDWHARKERWKKGGAILMKQKMEQIKKANSIIYLDADDNEGDDDSDYEEEGFYATMRADLLTAVRAQNSRQTRRGQV
ncbi:RING-type domain-containing protein [Pleurotus pulmonarius]